MHDPCGLYLDLMNRCLTYSLWPEAYREYHLERYGSRLSRRMRQRLRQELARRRLLLMEKIPYDPVLREYGRDWPATAHTMIGVRRLENIRHCLESAIRDSIPGDVIETGVWRGGATILMRAILKAHSITDRTVWVCDSFEGLPPPDAEKYPEDANSRYHEFADVLAVSLDEVKANFERYGLLDEQVRFLKGWFRDTLPSAPFTNFCVIRLDGDMFESTMDSLTHLYPRLSPGGFLIVDDYGLEDGLCRKAVDAYRTQHGIASELVQIDGHGVFWRKGRDEFALPSFAQSGPESACLEAREAVSAWTSRA